MSLRLHLHRIGLRYRKNFRPLVGCRISADIAFPRERLCIFVDGCFWHGCPQHFSPPKSNTAWWAEKISANQERDARQTEVLEEHGWVVLRYWEHEIGAGNLDRICATVSRAVQRRREAEH